MSPDTLVVDDSSFQRSLVSETIEEWVDVVDTAENGREAVERFDEIGPDVITMDIMMPDHSSLAKRQIAGRRPVSVRTDFQGCENDFGV